MDRRLPDITTWVYESVKFINSLESFCIECHDCELDDAIALSESSGLTVNNTDRRHVLQTLSIDAREESDCLSPYFSKGICKSP